MLKVGLIGVGNISGAHIPAWESFADTELVALCDIRKEVLKEYPQKRCYNNFEEMLQKESLDILDICLPTEFHVEYAIKALENGINVVCEKPVSLRAEDVDRIYSVAKKKDVKFMVAHVLRFWPEYELLKSVCESGQYGRLLCGSMSRRGTFPKWVPMSILEAGGLVPFDLHIHDLDFLRYVFGNPEHVYPLRARGSEQDCLHVLYDFGKFFVSAEASWFSVDYPFSAEYRFQFEDALITYEQGKCKVFENNGKVIDYKANISGDVGENDLPPTPAYENELRYFADCVLDNREPDKVKAEELKDVLMVLSQI